MKILVVGLGSMGKRRIRNLKHLEQNDVIGFDVREDRCKEVDEKYKIKTYSEIAEALKINPDAMVISTPPDLHMKYAKIAIQHKIHFFTEASVLMEEIEEVIEDLKKTDIIGFASHTMRYHPIIMEIKNVLKNNSIGKPLSFLYHSGQYLPDWHPFEDYRKFYVSKRKTGACREIVPFELLWILDIFDNVESVCAMKSKVSNLEADIDDIYNVLLNFKNGIQGNVSVDVIARFPYRQLKILGENGVIFADWSELAVRHYTKESGWTTKKINDGIVEKGYIHGEDMYIQEMKMFLKAIRKEIPIPYTFEDDLKVLQILESIEKSSEKGIREKIS